MVDESVWTPQDVLRVAESEAADFTNIKITKTAGLKKALDVFTKGCGIPCIVGCEAEACVAVGAKLQLAASLDLLPHMRIHRASSYANCAQRTAQSRQGLPRSTEGTWIGSDPRFESH
jgi:L-alanine-DL-glutamate epimerase-like enolase superfamily enzyme